MDWVECKLKKFVKEVNVDDGLISSLISSSNKKLESAERLELDDVTAETKVCLLYDSLRETLEGLAVKKGYKIYNHECFTAFLKEILEEDFFSDEFDRFRKIRNGINYYGNVVSVEDAKKIIMEIKNLRRKIFDKYLG